MKSLRESLLDDVDVVSDKLDMKGLIKTWLDKYEIKHYKIKDDNTINIKGSVTLGIEEEEFPEYIQFDIVTGDFILVFTQLKSLRGCPKTVIGQFSVSFSPNLESLEYGPEVVNGQYVVGSNDSLVSLKGCPKTLNHSFHCSNNRSLKTLEGAPKEIGGNFICQQNKELSSLKGFPKKIRGGIAIFGCKKFDFDKNDIKKICDVDIERINIL